MSRDPMQTIIARAKAIVRAVSITGSSDLDDWLILLVYAGCAVAAGVVLLQRYLFT